MDHGQGFGSAPNSLIAGVQRTRHRSTEEASASVSAPAPTRQPHSRASDEHDHLWDHMAVSGWR